MQFRMIYSIGHSTLDIKDFLGLIHPVQEVWDIWSHPTFRFTQFKQENLAPVLEMVGIKYCWEPRLGGWSKQYGILWRGNTEIRGGRVPV